MSRHKGCTPRPVHDPAVGTSWSPTRNQDKTQSREVIMRCTARRIMKYVTDKDGKPHLATFKAWADWVCRYRAVRTESSCDLVDVALTAMNAIIANPGFIMTAQQIEMIVPPLAQTLVDPYAVLAA